MYKPGWTLFLASVWMVMVSAGVTASAGIAGAEGLMQGAPPPPEVRVTRSNWLQPPYNRWGLKHL